MPDPNFVPFVPPEVLEYFKDFDVVTWNEPPRAVTKIDWTIKTGEKWWSGTDSKVQLDVFRDTLRLGGGALEPGHTPRLNRSEQARYEWKAPSTGIGTCVSGTCLPDLIAFPEGIHDHLRVRLTAKGRDAWEIEWIRSSVYYGWLQFIPGTIDSSYWVTTRTTFNFELNQVLSADPMEGNATILLTYPGFETP